MKCIRKLVTNEQSQKVGESETDEDMIPGISIQQSLFQKIPEIHPKLQTSYFLKDKRSKLDDIRPKCNNFTVIC